MYVMKCKYVYLYNNLIIKIKFCLVFVASALWRSPLSRNVTVISIHKYINKHFRYIRQLSLPLGGVLLRSDTCRLNTLNQAMFCFFAVAGWVEYQHLFRICCAIRMLIGPKLDRCKVEVITHFTVRVKAKKSYR